LFDLFYYTNTYVPKNKITIPVTTLFRKYSHSRRKWKKLCRLFENPDNEEEIKTVMDDFWKEHEATTPVFSSQKSKSIVGEILAVDNTEASHPVRKKVKWVYAAAAAVILVLVSTVLYNSGLNKNTGSQTAKSSTINKDVAPGGYRAVLTLADRSTIVLDSATNGILVQQGNTRIIKQDTGRVAYVSSNDKAGETLFNSIATPRGGEYQLVLSDGSKAWLNAASSLRFPATFGSRERRVEITGEVYFEVARDASKPFIVNVAGKGEVTVVGTHFNINAYSDEESVKTTLLEGRVKVSSSLAARVISPGEQVRLTANGQLSLHKDVDLEQVIAWKNGRFNFSNADLLTILRQLARWYDVDLAFEGAVPQKRFAGELQRDLNLSEVLRVLERNNVHFRIDGKKLVVLK
jgi:ferric-dicitrate binding protein FerR (iron transport regulator)